MSTKTIEVVLGPNESATINIVRVSRKVRVAKPMIPSVDENGAFTLLFPDGKPTARLGVPQYTAIFRHGHAEFTKEASARLGGTLGITARIISTISNIKYFHKKGKNLYGWHGSMPRLDDFAVTENEGKVRIDRKF